MKRRLRLDEQPLPRVWEIEVVGNVITLHSGIEHTPGKLTRIERPSEEAALKTAQQLVSQRLKDGFTDAPLEEGSSTLGPHSPEAEWLVYADALLTRGDPRGELMVLQARGDTKKAAAYLKKHADALLGDLAGVMNQVELTWRFGFIVSARITCEPKRRHTVMLENVLTALFNSPSVRMLRQLQLGWPGGRMNLLWYGIALEQLCSVQWPEYLDWLEIGAFDTERVREWPHVSDLRRLSQKRQLKYLVVRAAMSEFELHEHLSLRHLEFDGPSMSHRMVLDLLECRLPELRGLVLTIGTDSGMHARHLTPLASPRYMPGLVAMGVRQCREVTVFVERLVSEGRLAKLALLDLSENGLNETDGRWLLEHAALFLHLSKLVLRDNQFKPRMVAKLKAALPMADLGP